MKTASTLAQAMDLQALLSPHAVSSLPSEADANPVPTIRSQSLRSCFVSLYVVIASQIVKCANVHLLKSLRRK